MPPKQKMELICLLEEQHRRDKSKAYLRVFESFYDWQYEFVESTKDHYESCLCAANQIGKTYTGTEIDAVHLMGDYPDTWPGHRFEFPPLCWALGFSMEKTRDLLQTALFGKYQGGSFEGGLVPADRILDWESAGGTANAMRTVRVKHAKGIAKIQFWSYAQGHHALMGDVVDWFHVDEEPRDQNIRPQLLTRTTNGDRGRGGRGIYTFTPENGRTELVIKFMDDPTPDQFFMMKGWDDAPHMTQEKRDRMLALYPLHQRDMRSKGIPMLGHGRIYDLGDEFITCDPFEVPPHWFVIAGMDFGWDHPSAFAKLVEDRDTGDFYVVNAWKASKQSANNAWGACKSWLEGVPVAWPQDGLQNEKGRDDAVQQKIHYEDAGFKLLLDHATWDEGGNSVESGLYNINDLMSKGKFKIFKGLAQVLEEVRQYHRDEKGKIVKVKDDILDSIRIAYMMRRYAVQIGGIGKKRERPRIDRSRFE